MANVNFTFKENYGKTIITAQFATKVEKMCRITNDCSNEEIEYIKTAISSMLLDQLRKDLLLPTHEDLKELHLIILSSGALLVGAQNRALEILDKINRSGLYK